MMSASGIPSALIISPVSYFGSNFQRNDNFPCTGYCFSCLISLNFLEMVFIVLLYHLIVVGKRMFLLESMYFSAASLKCMLACFVWTFCSSSAMASIASFWVACSQKTPCISAPCTFSEPGNCRSLTTTLQTHTSRPGESLAGSGILRLRGRSLPGTALLRIPGCGQLSLSGAICFNKLHRCSLHRIPGTGIPLGAGKGRITASGLYGPAPL